MMQEEQVKLWGDKPYYSLDHYFKKTFGTKVYKIALNAGMTCPVRDGTLGSRGCIFCSKGGSGDFASAAAVNGKPDIKAQLEEGKKLVSSKNPVKYLAYFQAYTNTYAPADELRSLYKAALDDRDVIGISIATRPDCLPDEVLKLLDELKREYPKKVIWIELGLQTIHRETVKYIRRGYEASVFELAVHRLNDMGIPVVVHVILGLPGESVEMMHSTIEYLNTFPIFGIKLQLLHVLSGTDMADDFEARKFDVLTRSEYTDIVISCMELLSPEIVIHRLTGDGPKSILIAPGWSGDKKTVMNGIHSEMRKRNTFQGRLYGRN